jgi:hypothetical protein
LFLSLAFVAIVARADEPPANAGLGLRQLIQARERSGDEFRAIAAKWKHVQSDAADRVIVNIGLDGSKAPEELAAAVAARGAEVLQVDTAWRNGTISARLPITKTREVARMPGVKSVRLAPKPIRHAGAVTAESSVVDRAAIVNAAGTFAAKGILGRGISVGVVSDSYDADPTAPRASAGVASGDLPGAGNPDGYNQPVVVIDDNFAPNAGQTDEGRAMAEIVHDIAPAAKLAFSTVQQTQSIMAYSIRNLRANTAASCDIIVDDVFFADEPFFSDGPLALAVEDVVNGTTLPGKKVVYFSAAGNEANHGYTADLRLLTPAQGTSAAVPAPTPGATPPQLHWEQVPPALYAGGFHNINASGAPAVAMPVNVDSAVLLDFQWDDPFDAKAVTTDYNLLVFDDSGNFISSFSGTDDNVSTDEPIELLFLQNITKNPSQNFYLVISLATKAPPIAQHLRFIAPQGDIAGPYLTYEATSMAGHATAASANAVSAYLYNSVPERDPKYNPDQTNPPPGPYEPELESFTSNGGALAFYFDAQGNRLATPQIRNKPDIAAAEGVDTTFFGTDLDNDTFPNFSGTSAAAPTAAGIAALMFEAAGGPGKLSAADVRSIMERTAFAHDLDPFFASATAASAGDVVTVAAHGNASNQSAFDPNFFTVTFNGFAGERLDQLQIDLSNVQMVFDDDPRTGYPFTVGNNPNGIVVVPQLSPDKQVLTLTFTNFQSGDTLSFGIDRDFAGTHAGGNSADVLAGARIVAQVDDRTLPGAFANNLGSGWTLADGYGLIDAAHAVSAVLNKQPAIPRGIARNISTRAFIGGDTSSYLIGGFIVQGTNAKKIIARALGPSLTNSGVATALPDPFLELHDANGNTIAANNNWQDDPNQANEIQSDGLAPNDPRESALVATVSPSSYTAVVHGANASVGNALVEVYDVDGGAQTQLVNLSTRGLVLQDDSVMIGGFILNGDASSNVIVRALGPSLAARGVSDVLDDPTLELRDNQGNLVAQNDNWQQDSLQAMQIATAGLGPTNALESALALTLDPGNYTTVVRSASGHNGVGLVEMYNVR